MTYQPMMLYFCSTKFYTLNDNLDSNNKVLDLFLDIKMAFDSVNHAILLKKLYQSAFEEIFII